MYNILKLQTVYHDANWEYNNTLQYNICSFTSERLAGGAMLFPTQDAIQQGNI